MNDVVLSITSALAGAAALPAVLYAIDRYRSWNYRRERLSELRERPDVPHSVRRITLHVSSDYWSPDAYWIAYAYDADGEQLEYDTDTHPMDAVKNVLTELDSR